MTNPTLERAARAAADAGAKLSNGPSLYANNPDIYQKIARAVLMAVREPDVKALFDGIHALQLDAIDVSSGRVNRDQMSVMFTAMIDAILNDGDAA